MFFFMDLSVSYVASNAGVLPRGTKRHDSQTRWPADNQLVRIVQEPRLRDKNEANVRLGSENSAPTSCCMAKSIHMRTSSARLSNMISRLGRICSSFWGQV